MATPCDHESVHSPATTVLTFSATSCCSPFTATSAPSTISSAPSSPADDKFRHHQHDRPSIDSIAVNAIAAGDDAWQHITDPKERRKIQNRIAQRKYREKEAAKREQSRRDARNQQLAGGSYARPWVRDTETFLFNNTSERITASNPFVHQNTSTRTPSNQDVEQGEFSGVPWGGLNFGHMAQRSQMEYQNEQRDMMLRWEQRQRLLAQRDWMQRQRQVKAQRREEQHRRIQDFQSTMTAVLEPFAMPPPNIPADALAAASMYGTNDGRMMLPPQHIQQESMPALSNMDTFGSSMFFSSNFASHTEATPIDPALLVSMGGCGAVGPEAMGMGLDQAQIQALTTEHGGGAEENRGGAGGGAVLSPTFPIEDEMEIELLAWPD